ncbi:uncharacterized protein M421DRAFT_277298 [Didymella exigua CBS 183.55]|uniref:Uncharacterized protein n=1 Tax=Didymella exigua CBS 183.55 TaxID=1150837 RepID=A0A6A5RBK3_9PLEO|nr:uncharacterized protein M421DRAFT_277298 [Didymella exigua CBS 183.55]KAF1924578.1 hypothetical protein M421DRAFT_277298 [Didymella exigua CBS 183.55]
MLRLRLCVMRLCRAMSPAISSALSRFTCFKTLEPFFFHLCPLQSSHVANNRIHGVEISMGIRDRSCTPSDQRKAQIHAQTANESLLVRRRWHCELGCESHNQSLNLSGLPFSVVWASRLNYLPIEQRLGGNGRNES